MLTSFVSMLVIGALLGLLLGIASKVLYVKPDDRLEKIMSYLPSLNCGACGYVGCQDLAQAIVDGEATGELCKVSTKESKIQLNEYLEELKKELHSA